MGWEERHPGSDRGKANGSRNEEFPNLLRFARTGESHLRESGGGKSQRVPRKGVFFQKKIKRSRRRATKFRREGGGHLDRPLFEREGGLSFLKGHHSQEGGDAKRRESRGWRGRGGIMRALDVKNYPYRKVLHSGNGKKQDNLRAREATSGGR